MASPWGSRRPTRLPASSDPARSETRVCVVSQQQGDEQPAPGTRQVPSPSDKWTVRH